MCTYWSRLFVFLWSSALVFSGLSSYYSADSLALLWPTLIPVITGVSLVVLPDSMKALRLSAVGYLASFALQMPATPNHRWVLLYVALALLETGFTRKSVEETAGAIQGSLRWLTIVVYGFAALAKCNTTYFDPTISCAATFSRQTFELYGLSHMFGTNTAIGISVGSLLIEAVIPILLIWPRSRWAGICIGVLFHVALSLNLVRYFGNFSAVMFVLLFSWCSEERCKRIWMGIDRMGRPAVRMWSIALGLLPILTITSVLPLGEYVIARHVLYLFFAGLLLMCAAQSCRASSFLAGRQQGAELGSRVGAPSLLILGFAILNSSTPYLGIKTRSALTMYST